MEVGKEMNDAGRVGDKTIEVIEERFYSPHHLLLKSASASLMAAQGRFEGGRDVHILTVMVMSALAIEALCNAIGHRVLKGWEDFEQIPPWAKIRLICKALEIPYDRGKAPWQQLQLLLSFRNTIAHGQPEHVMARRVVSETEYAAQMNDCSACYPESKFEKKLTVENARIALATVRQVEDVLTVNIPDGLKMGITVDAWTHTARDLQRGHKDRGLKNKPRTKAKAKGE